MRIIFLYPDPPVPWGNAASRWYYVQFRQLTKRGHQVTAFCCSADPEKYRTEIDHLFPQDEFDLRVFATDQRGTVIGKIQSLIHPNSYLLSSELKKNLQRELAKGYDILHLQSQWVGYISGYHPEKTVMEIHFLHSIDFHSHDPRHIKDYLIRYYLLKKEKDMVKKFKNKITLSSRLKDAMTNLSPGHQITVIPLAIDLSLYSFIPADKRPDPSTQIVTLIGSMGWIPTYSAAKRIVFNIWPLILSQLPKAELRIVGWGAKKISASCDLMENIEIIENVPDIKPYFANASILLYPPARASGMKVKVVEAMAFGLPVVSNADGLEGIPAVDSIHALIAESDQELADKAVSLLKNSEMQERMRNQARNLIEEVIHTDKVLNRLENTYLNLTKTSQD